MIPRATYRFQFHADFTFAHAEALIPYLDRLGVSHIYASPVTTARRGSRHGYDVVDPTRVDPEIGGEEGLRRLSSALAERGMGIIADIVPNHMGIAGGENRWWQDVLENGQASGFARFFDIDWRRRLALPVLADPLPEVIAAGDLRLVEAGGSLMVQLYGGTTYPLRSDDPVLAIERGAALASHDPAAAGGRAALAALVERQHYRLIYWRAANDELNWRRFFSINELAGLRVEDMVVFEETHRLIFGLFRDGVIDGVRVDHVDGLSDPATYCHRLRAGLEAVASGRRPYVVVEKILAPDERLPMEWGVDGTSGYDFMCDVLALLHDPAGAEPLRANWAEISGRPADFACEEFEARRQLLSWQFEGQLRACTETFAMLARTAAGCEWITHGMLRRALECLLWVFPVYRTYGTGRSAPPEDEAVREAARRAVEQIAPPSEAAVAMLILDWLKGNGPGDADLAAEAVRHFQQLSAPIAAKAVEDTAFYRYGVLLSANEVGSDPSRFALPVADFHAAMRDRTARAPCAMLATATHDHKRGPDARARLAVLSGVPDVWDDRLRQWMELVGPDGDGLDAGDICTLFQTLVGAWNGAASSSFLARLHGWQEKALREAKLRSSWVAPDEAYEARYKALATALLTANRHADFRADFAGFLQAIAPAATANSLAQTALHLTVPGVPDIYRGSEILDFSMVDPDNRRPVDYGRLERILAGEGGGGPDAAKLCLIAQLLGLRRNHPVLFTHGDYRPLPVTGPRAEHVVAFLRREGRTQLVCAVAIRLARALVGSDSARPSGQWWRGTKIDLGNGRALPAARLFSESVAHFRIV